MQDAKNAKRNTTMCRKFCIFICQKRCVDSIDPQDVKLKEFNPSGTNLQI